MKIINYLLSWYVALTSTKYPLRKRLFLRVGLYRALEYRSALIRMGLQPHQADAMVATQMRVGLPAGLK